jgi:tRNA threonylcarbamoyladenosine biosynthesis protein TsaE
MKQEIIYNLEQLPEVAQKLATELKDYSIVTLTGELGAGKTTLAKELLRNWGVQGEVLSPTFTYVNCYKNEQGAKFFHFDLYRIQNLDTFFELGFDEYLGQPNSLCLIEWPQVIDSLLKDGVVSFQIEHLSDDKRKLIRG